MTVPIQAKSSGWFQTLYHYTDAPGLAGIVSSGKILQTQGVTGTGVFLTRLLPANSTDLIARNNYNNAYQYKLDKVTCYVRILLPVHELQFDSLAQGRDIFWIAGKDVELDQYT